MNMIAKVVVIVLAVATSGCATAPGEAGDGAGLGTIVGNLVREHHRADRAAVRALGDLFGGAIGYRRGKDIDASVAEREAAAIRAESGWDPDLTIQSVPDRLETGKSVEVPIMQSIKMEVAPDEMLTAEGTLHPRAARALARMESLAREHGGDFSVSVPRSRVETAAAIKEVAPTATIFETDEEEHYRLVVIAAERQ